MRIPSVAAGLAIALALAACESSPTDSTPTQTSFSAELRLGSETAWTGYSVQGHQPAGTPSSTVGEWVHMVAGGGNVLLKPRKQQPDGTWIEFETLVSVLARGDSMHLIGPLDPCNRGLPCGRMSVILNATRVEGTPREVCHVNDGALVFTRATAEWVSATFSGTGNCTFNGTVTRTFSLRNGKFDAAISLAPPTGGG